MTATPYLHPVITDAAHGLLGGEEANDRAIVSAAALIQTIVADRGQVKLKFGDVQTPLSDVGKALSLAIEARAHWGRCHRRLHELGVGQGLFAPTGHGDVFPTQDDGEDQPKAQAIDVLPVATTERAVA